MAAKKKPLATAKPRSAPKNSAVTTKKSTTADKPATAKKAAPKPATAKKPAAKKAPAATAPTAKKPAAKKATPKPAVKKAKKAAPKPAAKKAAPKPAKGGTPAGLAQQLRKLLEGEDAPSIHAKGVELFSAITQGTKGELHLGLLAVAFRRAGELGHAEAWVDFGQCLQNGWGVDPDEEAALAAYAKAASMGSDQGAYALAANAYWHQQDFAAAQAWAKKALRGGDPVGAVHYLLGRMAFHGQGVRANKKKSYELHETAAKRGDSDAMFELFAMASTGQGTKKDEPTAVVWLMEAAKRNHPRALFNLGAFHAMGSFGFAEDLEAAASFYEAASENGHGRASATLGTMYLGGKGVRKSDKKAAEFFERAEAQGFDVQEFLEGLG
ncbi:MAG: sel1 repeat family protein [Myxococcales bacterium]|jgi:TPR repeat protein|nr:sel1 repeat family protein [Myxococcales bacterium]HQY63768.1 tetratricopeptide repeat protein [Polyangiaceae bacterium]